MRLDLFADAFKETNQKLLGIVLLVAFKKRTIFIKCFLKVPSTDNLLTASLRLVVEDRQLSQYQLLFHLLLFELLVLEVSSKKRSPD